MISSRTVLLFVVFALVCVGIAWAEEPGPIDVKGFSVPESVYWDPAGDYYLVSNINGTPTDADGNGFVSKVATDGTIVDLKWIDGATEGVTLSAPKGITTFGDTLYVTDITAVRTFDRRTGAPTGSIEIPGSLFLNDPAAAPDGTVYVSDMMTQKIHRIAPDGTVTVYASGDQLGKPNGVAVDANGKVFVCAMAAPEVYGLTPDGKKDPVWKVPAGGLDGLVLTDAGALVSSWQTETI